MNTDTMDPRVALRMRHVHERWSADVVGENSERKLLEMCSITAAFSESREAVTLAREFLDAHYGPVYVADRAPTGPRVRDIEALLKLQPAPPEIVLEPIPLPPGLRLLPTGEVETEDGTVLGREIRDLVAIVLRGRWVQVQWGAVSELWVAHLAGVPFRGRTEEEQAKWWKVADTIPYGEGAPSASEERWVRSVSATLGGRDPSKDL